MGESVGLDSDFEALATFAFQSSVSLDEIVQDLGARNTRVYKLQDELGELRGVLSELTKTANATGIDLSALGRPLLQCGSVCKAFEREIMRCSSNSDNGSVKLWDLRYMGENIDGFTQLLTNYTNTITIALEEANLNIPSLTVEVLEEYKTLVATAIGDLEEHVEGLNKKLQDMIGRTLSSPNLNSKELQLIQEELMSAQKCLEICAHFSGLISQIHSPPERSHSNSEFEREVSKAKTYRRGNISIIDNDGIGDLVQFMVSTDPNKVIYGRNRGLGRRTRQYGGYIDSATLQKISGDHAISLPTWSSGGRSARGKAPSGFDGEAAESGAEARGGLNRRRHIPSSTHIVGKPAKPKGSASGNPSGLLKK